MRLLVRLGLVILLLALAAAVYQLTPSYPDLGGEEDVKLYPIDQAEQNQDLLEFRKRFIDAVKAKDLDFVLEHIDDTIKYTFGLNEGTAGFLREWELDQNPDQSRFWDETLEVLMLGGEFTNPEKTLFTAPYVFTSFPEDLDAFQHVAVIEREVKVYREPNRDADVLGVLNYSIVRNLTHNDRYVFESNGQLWRKIETFSSQIGYVPDQYLRSPVDYRLSFYNQGPKWQLIFFVAGD